jgi:hypothetical protein
MGRLAIAAAAAVLAACTNLAPPYERPVAPVSADWPARRRMESQR